MKVQEFEDFLVQTRIELTTQFKDIKDISDMDIYIKTVLDYQETVAKMIFRELNELQNILLSTKGDLLKDNRERFGELMKELKKRENE